jgi:Mg-chelatase subunit ChlD
MKQDYTHICIVLDASGSMEAIKEDTKGTFRSFLSKQKEEKGQTTFDLYQFSETTERIVRHADLATFGDDLMSQYACTGWTAMNDAICTAIDTLGRELAEMPEEERPEAILFAIITDGEENASREFTTADVKARVAEQTSKYNWHFEFLAANQDAVLNGTERGIPTDNCHSYEATPEGMRKNATVMASMCCMAREEAVKRRKAK